MESAILALKKVYLRPPGVLVGDVGDILLVAPERLRREVSHQIWEDQLKRALDVLVGCLEVSSLSFFSHGANVTVWYGSIETHSVVIYPVQQSRLFWLRCPIRGCERVVVASACIASSGALLQLTRSNENKYMSFSSSWSETVRCSPPAFSCVCRRWTRRRCATLAQPRRG